MKAIPHDQMLKIQEAVVSARLAENRAALLVGVPQNVIANIPKAASPAAQILMDLDHVNDVGVLPDGTFPLRSWLSNAASLAAPRSEAAVFRAALDGSGPAAAARSPSSTAEAHAMTAPPARTAPTPYLPEVVDFFRHFKIPEDICKAVLQTFRDDNIEELLPIQVRAIEAVRRDSSRNLVIVAPTSSGKTFFGELMSLTYALRQKKLYYLVPFRALAEEKGERFSRLYGSEELGLRTVVCTGDRKDSDIELYDGRFDIAVLTYEKLATLLVTRPGLLWDAGGVVVDEVQMLADESRGAALEILLTTLRRLRPDLQILCLAAVVSDLNKLDVWLGATVVRDDRRPVPLREGVVSPGRQFEFVVRGPSMSSQQEKLFAKPAQIQTAADLAVELLRKDEYLLVFAETVPKSKELAEQIAGRCNFLRPATATIQRLADLEQLEVTQQLSKTLQHSVAFHNADLPLEERLAIETAFRNGDVKCVVATSTLAMGVNLLASTVLVSSTKKWQNTRGTWGTQPITTAEYRNMAGRAGRFGKTAAPFGRSVIWADTRIVASGVMQDYVLGETEPMGSVLMKRSPGKQILSIIATMRRLSWNDMSELFRSSYAAFSGAPEVVTKWLSEVEDQLERVRALNLATNRDGFFELTELGRICAASGLEIETFQEILDLADTKHVSAGSIAVIACRNKDTGPEQSGVRMTKRDDMARWHEDLATYASLDGSPVLRDHLARTEDSYSDRSLLQAKFLLLAFSYVSGVDSPRIEKTYATVMARVKIVGLNCARLCDALALVYVVKGHLDLVEQAERLAERFRIGGSEATLFLSQTGRALHRVERERLVQAGYTTSESLIEASADEIARAARVGRSRVAATQKKIRELMGVALGAEKDHISRLELLREDTRRIVSLYHDKGAGLKTAIAELLSPPFLPLSITRSADEDEGEADLILRFDDGYNGVAQVTAKETSFDKVGPTIAGAVLQQSPELMPEVFLCFGRPDFDTISIRKAHALAQRYNYKLVPIYVLAELFVRWKEGKITSDRARDLLRNYRGYLALDVLDAAVVS